MRYIRTRVPGSRYFFTVNLANRANDLLINEFDILRNAIYMTKIKYPFKTNAYVVLPDHMHIIMTLPPNDSNFSLRWSMIKGLFSKQISHTESIALARKKKRERGIWQRRFWEHLIRDELDYEYHVNYIHFNPVKHGYVDKPSNWQYSSIHSYIEKGILPNDWAWVNPFTSGNFGE